MRNNVTLWSRPGPWRIARRRYTDRWITLSGFDMPRLSLVALCAALAGAMLALPAQAQWKWRDKGGQIQYSDLPPPSGVSEQDILQRPTASQQRRPAAGAPAAAPASGAPLKTVDPELEAKRKKAEQDTEAKNKAAEEKLAAARAENCARAKGYLRSIDDGLRIARTNDKGEREILDEKARADEARRTREIIATDCK